MNIAHLFTTPVAVYDNFTPHSDLVASVAMKRGNIETHITTYLLLEQIEDTASDYSSMLWGRGAIVNSPQTHIINDNESLESAHTGSSKLVGVYFATADSEDTIAFTAPFDRVVEINQNKIIQLGAKSNRLILFPAYLKYMIPERKRIFPTVLIDFELQLKN